MNALQPTDEMNAIEILPEDVPVTMPELPPQLVINTLQQFKAISDPIRSRILGIIQNQPATARQIADRLGASHDPRLLIDVIPEFRVSEISGTQGDGEAGINVALGPGSPRSG